ncbi:MAG: hypothetical protein V1772_10295, partial [Chloroflexota bacterium]
GIPMASCAVYEDFTSAGDFAARWKTYTVGAGTLEPTGSTLCFVNANTTRRQTTNAQIDDYQGLSRRRYPWHPPLTMAVRARFSHPAGRLSGTAGFGFWNDPFMMTGRASLALPRALWFFYASPPSDMALALDTPGSGWKAAALDATRPAALAWASLAPLAVPLMNLRPLYRWLWPRIQRALGICEAVLQVDMAAWHTYVLEWDADAVRCTVDGEPVLACDRSPRGPMGFVMWLDNQYLVATPWGRFRYGRLETPGRQWMEVDTLSIEPGPRSAPGGG